jgi:hypothetical protein
MIESILTWASILISLSSIGFVIFTIYSRRRSIEEGRRQCYFTISSTNSFRESMLSDDGRAAIHRAVNQLSPQAIREVMTGRSSSDWVNHYTSMNGVRVHDFKLNVKTGQKIDIKPEIPTLPEVRRLRE